VDGAEKTKVSSGTRRRSSTTKVSPEASLMVSLIVRMCKTLRRVEKWQSPVDQK
jgi:hypothetical protein